MVGECLGAKNKPRVDCDGDESRCLFYSDRRRKAKAVTNADRIRAMTDEELAEYLCKAIRDGVMMIFPGAHYSKDDIAELNQNWLDWLREEATP
jgi:hypothetical protein